MHAFQEVGDRIRDAFRAAEYDETKFPEIATAALREAAIPSRVGLDEMADWVLGAEPLPRASVSKTFSDAGFCAYYDSRFVVEVLTWVEASTAIHQHNFCGAFQVLEGGSLHTEYAFFPMTRVNERLAFGELQRGAMRTLSRGDVHPIEAGADFIHRLYHLERPSMTIVARTFVQTTFPQYAYVEPGIRYDPFNRPEELEQQFKMLEVLRRLSHPSLEERVCELVRRYDKYMAYSVAQAYGPVLYERRRTDRFDEVLNERFGDEAALVRASMVSAERFNRIVGLRFRVKESDKRFFLAVLLNASTKAELFDAIRARFPNDEPSELVLSWLREMSGLAGFFEFDDAGIEFLKAALRCDSKEAIVRELEGDCGAGKTFGDREMLDELDGNFRNSILEPLLS